MNTLDTIVQQILSRYTCFTLPSDISNPHDFSMGKEIISGGDYALVIKDFICLACYANTYATNDYVVVNGDNDNISKRLFLSRDEIPNENKFGNGMDKFLTCNISNPKFKLEGRGMAVAIFEKDTLDLVQTYYFVDHSMLSLFTTDKDSLCVIYNNQTYIQKYGDYGTDFYLTINGTAACFGNYLVVYSDDPYYNYDFATSISIIDLKLKKEYILSEILKELHVNLVDAGSVKFDIKTKSLSFKDGDMKEYRLRLSDIKKCCKAVTLNKEEEEHRYLGCITELITGYNGSDN